MSRRARIGELFWTWLLPVILVLAGAALLASSSGQSDRERLIAAAPVEAMAVVTSLDDEVSVRSGMHTYTATVNLELRDGTVIGAVLDPEPDAAIFVVGEPVAVTYSAQNPRAVVVTERRYDFVVTRVWEWIVLAVGVVAIAAAAFMTRVLGSARRRR